MDPVRVDGWTWQERRHVRLITQTARLLLANGAAAADVADLVARAVAAGGSGLTGEVVIGYDVVTVTCRRRGDELGGDVLVMSEPVPARGFDFGVYTAAAGILERYAAGGLSVAEFAGELERLQGTPRSTPTWLTRGGSGFAGASASLIFGGDALVVAIAFLCNLFIDWMFGFLGRRGWPLFFLQVLTGVIAGLSAWAARAIDPSANSSALVVAVIIVMLAGMTSTGAVQDAITGWYVSAWGRVFDAIVKTLGLVIGIRLALALARAVGHPPPVSADVSMNGLPTPWLLLAGALVAVGFSVVAGSPRRAYAPSALLCVLGTVIYLATMSAGVVLSSAVAAVVIGFLAKICAARFRAPTAIFGSCAILPLLPGVALYQGVAVVTDDLVRGGGQIFTALGTALALAAGLSLGAYLAAVLPVTGDRAAA